MHGITIFKLIVIVVALATVFIAAVNFMTTSYEEYSKYYESVMAEKEYQKYLESLPLTFDGLSATLNDGVNYYATGKARPKKEDLTVIAHFSEKGKETDKILDVSEFEMVVPEDFSINGGKITVKYLYQPEKTDENAEDPAPVIRATEVEVSLVPVVLTELKVIASPYRIYYSDQMEFDKEGIRLQAKFNCGDSVILDESDVQVAYTKKLIAGTEKVTVSYSNGDVNLLADVPVTVVSEAEYDDGAITKIKADDNSYAMVLHGSSPTTANAPAIRATYESGNRLLLSPSDYSVGSELETAYFYNTCVLKISLNSNPDMCCYVAANVVYDLEAENADAVGGTKADVSDALYSSDATVGTMTGFNNGDSLTFTVNSECVVKSPLYIRIANMSDSEVDLAQIMRVKVNGRYVPISLLSVVQPSRVDNTDTYTFNICYLSEIVLNKGENTVELSFLDMSGASVAIDHIRIETKYEGVISSDTEEHIFNSFEAGIEPELTVELVKDFHAVTGGLYIHGMCTDGTYIYVARTTDLEDEKTVRCIMVSKYDAVTFEHVGNAALSADASCEANAGITYYDGKIIIFYNNGTEWCIDPSLTGEWTEYTGFAFEGTEGKAIRDVYYNSLNGQFAVFVGETVTVYGKDMKAITSFNFENEASGLKSARMSGSSDYIYVTFNKDGVYKPTVQMYDWSGNYIGRFVAPNSPDVFGSFNSSKTNIQGMTIVNGDIIFAQIRWTTKGSAFLKVSYPTVKTELDYDLTVGEYVAAAVDGNVATSANASSEVKISATGVYAMGGVYDGEYLYISMNGLKNLTTTISKVDPITLKVVGETVTFVPAEVDGDNSKIFLKDGKLYCIIRDGSMYEIDVDELNGVSCDVTKSELTFAQYGTAISAVWSDVEGKFAVLTNDKKLHIVNEDLSTYVKNIALSNGSAAPSSVTCDEKFIYVSYKASSDVPVDVYTWDGEKVGSVTVSGFNLGSNVDFNVQAIFFMNGRMHATVCSWTNGQMVYHDWIVEINESDLK